MSPGMPNYTKLTNGSNAGVYTIPPSPPPDPDKIRSSHTLFEMLSNDHTANPSTHHRFPTNPHSENPSPHQSPENPHFQQLMLIDQRQQQQQNNFIPLINRQSFYASKQELSTQERVNAVLCSPVNGFNDPLTSDLKLTLISRDGGLTVTVNVHTRILVSFSKYFASKLSYKQQGVHVTNPYSVEISDCEDVEIYLITIKLMYCSLDVKRMLLRENVPRVLAILKVASAIVFEAAITACLEYLEAVPWSEDEEEKVVTLVSQLEREYPTASRSVLSRVARPSPRTVLALPPVSPKNNQSPKSQSPYTHMQPEEVIVKLVNCVMQATDEKARREMKALVLKLLHENCTASNRNSSILDISKESLYDTCKECLNGLSYSFSMLTEDQTPGSSPISRHVDNIQWLTEVLIDRGIAEELVQIWSRETKLAEAHKKVLAVHRYEVSKITARLCIGIGRGQIMAGQAVRAKLLNTWLNPLMDDFCWIQRMLSKTCGGLDRRAIEEGICQTILTLSLEEQKLILLGWFERFAKDGEDCPNLQRAFEVWWRRSFVYGAPRQLQAPK